MVNSREIVELIEEKISYERNWAVIDALQGVVKEIEKLEEKEMNAMYAEYMQTDKLTEKWQELEAEFTK